MNIFVLVGLVDNAARNQTGENQVRTTAANDLISDKRKAAGRQTVHGPQPSVGWYVQHY